MEPNSAESRHDADSRFRNEQLVIPLRVPRRSRVVFTAFSVIAVPFVLFWVVSEPSLEAVIAVGLVLLSVSLVWGTLLVGRRARDGAPMQIVVMRNGLSSATWALDWARVERMWIGVTSAGLRALFIQPCKPSDIRLVRSRLLAFVAWLDRKSMKTSAIRLLEVNIDRPLEQLAGELEQKAGRKLLT